MPASFPPLSATQLARALEPSTFATDVAFMGDSRNFYAFKRWQAAVSSNWGGLTTSGIIAAGAGGWVDTDLPTSGTGTVDFRASDGSARWTAPSDTAGPYTVLKAGWNTLVSGGGAKKFFVPINHVTGLPGSDQAGISVTFGDGNPQLFGWMGHSLATKLLQRLRWPNLSVRIFNIGGAVCSDMATQIPYINTLSTGQGFDIWRVGTNDITNGTSASSCIASMFAAFEARRKLHPLRKGIIIGESARWDVTGGVGTPLNSTKQAILTGLNAFYQEYAQKYDWIYIDLLSITQDPSFTDLRPITSPTPVLRDTVHDSDYGADVMAAYAASVIGARVGYGPASTAYDPNAFPWGHFSGSGGATANGITGTCPTGMKVWFTGAGVGSGTCNLEARADNGGSGNWLRVTAAFTGAGTLRVQSNSNFDLASLGMTAGSDSIYTSTDYQILSASGIQQFVGYTFLTGTTPSYKLLEQAQQVSLGFTAEAGTVISPTGPGTLVMQCPSAVIPAGVTNAQKMIDVVTTGPGSIDFRVGAFKQNKGSVTNGFPI